MRTLASLTLRRPGLRTTISVSFALGGLFLATAMALGTYLAARNYLIDQRERAAMRQAFTDASFLQDGLLTSGASVSEALGAVSPPADAVLVVRRRDEWFSSSLQVGEDDVPARLRAEVGDGSAAVAWHRRGGAPNVLVGVPLPAVEAQFFELASTRELERTLDALRVVLTIFAVITAVACALLGRWAARRVLAPLDNVAGAAARIASGALGTRLGNTHDPDLATIVASFNSMVDALHDRIERDARFAADVSHELRTPLTTLVTGVEVLQGRRDELTPRARQALDLVSRDLDRFQRVLQDLLDLGRLEAGAAALVLAPVDLRELVRHGLETSDRHPSLLRTDGDEPVIVHADKAAMHRALLNLFENADRYGGGLTGVAVASTAHTASITVEDQGPGVPPSDRLRIFDRFVRGGSRGSLPGAGLGLSLVAETVRAHHGTVRCQSGADGAGARFIIDLPLDGADRGDQ